jgi:signal transduction histidine kinase
MKLVFRERLTLLIALVAAIVLALVWISLDAARLLVTLRRQTSAAQIESLKLADHLEKWTLRANQLLLYETITVAQRPERFRRHADELREWLMKKEPLFAAKDERALLVRIRASFAEYIKAADVLLDTATSESNGSRAAAAPGTPRFELEHASTELLARAIELGQLHARRQAVLVNASEASLRRLEFYGLLGLVALCGSVVALMWRAYRIHVAPLRLQVIEAREFAHRQEKLASLGVLAAGVAHEIRNPLTAVKARLFTLGRRLPAESAALTDTRLIDAEITRLEKIVQDFLTFARPRDLNCARLSVRGLLSEVRDLLAEPLAADCKSLTLEEGPDAEVSADHDLLKQVLINLVRNASEAVPPDTGAIVLRTARVADTVVIEIVDNGTGIPLEVQERLFDPFFTTKSAGTGLGLSIALRIVEQHGGKLRYQTTPNRGTTFGIVLPVV